jgi:hypothetical protein
MQAKPRCDLAEYHSGTFLRLNWRLIAAQGGGKSKQTHLLDYHTVAWRTLTSTFDLIWQQFSRKTSDANPPEIEVLTTIQQKNIASTRKREIGRAAHLSSFHANMRIQTQAASLEDTKARTIILTECMKQMYRWVAQNKNEVHTQAARLGSVYARTIILAECMKQMYDLDAHPKRITHRNDSTLPLSLYIHIHRDSTHSQADPH